MAVIDILTLDDDEDFNRILALHLKRIKVSVETFTDPAPFFQRVKDIQPNICILDINLGNNFGAGVQALRALRKFYPEDKMAIFVLTKRSDRSDIEEALNYGANEYITKPLDEIVLGMKVSQYIKVPPPLKSLPFNDLPTSARKVSFSIRSEILELSENGIKIEARQMLPKGRLIKADIPLFHEILAEDRLVNLSVTETWNIPDDAKFGASLEFDADDKQLLKSVRHWLRKNGKKKEEVLADQVNQPEKEEPEK